MYEFIYNGVPRTCIPKDQLVVGATYRGLCRNATEAVWLGEEFEYTRYKFGYEFPERIKHPEDDGVYDVFAAKERIK